MNDQKIVDLLRKGKRSLAFKKLYGNYPTIKKFICSKGGTVIDAEDIFQEALIVFYRKAKNEEFKLSSTIGTYLFSVCRFLWKDELKKRKKHQMIDFDTGLLSKEEEDLSTVSEKESRFKQVEKVLKQIGDRCLEILKLFYYKQQTMRLIAEKLDLKSEKIAKNQKYKCLERAKLKLAALRMQEVNYESNKLL